MAAAKKRSQDPEDAQKLRLSLTRVKEEGEEEIDVSVASDIVEAKLEGGELLGALTVKGALTRQDDEAAFDGSVRGKWRIECTRCLIPVEQEFAAAVEVRAPIDGGPMDVADEVRQSIVLAQPMKVYCRPDCRGLCPVCRKNLNTVKCGHKPPDPGPAAPNRPKLA